MEVVGDTEQGLALGAEQLALGDGLPKTLDDLADIAVEAALLDDPARSERRSEYELQAHLGDSRRLGTRNHAEVRSAERIAWRAEIGVIQNVEEFRPEFEAPRFGKRERLLHVEIDVEQPRHNQRPGFRIPVRVQRSELERVGVEPAVYAAIRTGEVTIGNAIRPLRGSRIQPRHAAQSRDIKRAAGLNGR